MLHRIVTDKITQPIGVPRREVQESLERLRLVQAGILRNRPAVLTLQRSKQAPQIPHSMGPGIRPVKQRPGPRADTLKLRIPRGKIFSCHCTVREIGLFRGEYGHASNNGTCGGRIHEPTSRSSPVVLAPGGRGGRGMQFLVRADHPFGDVDEISKRIPFVTAVLAAPRGGPAVTPHGEVAAHREH